MPYIRQILHQIAIDAFTIKNAFTFGKPCIYYHGYICVMILRTLRLHLDITIDTLTIKMRLHSANFASKYHGYTGWLRMIPHEALIGLVTFVHKSVILSVKWNKYKKQIQLFRSIRCIVIPIHYSVLMSYIGEVSFEHCSSNIHSNLQLHKWFH